MKYVILLDRRVAKELLDLPAKILKRLDLAMQNLASNPRPPKAIRLEGRKAEGWRIRVGDYRILYRIDDKARHVAIYKIGPRRDVYCQ